MAGRSRLTPREKTDRLMQKLLRRIAPQRISPNVRQASGNAQPVGDKGRGSKAEPTSPVKLRIDTGRRAGTNPGPEHSSTEEHPSIEEQLLTTATQCLRVVRNESTPSNVLTDPPLESPKSNGRDPAAIAGMKANGGHGSATGGAKSASKIVELTKAPVKAGTARVQLRLSKATVRILAAFSQAGRHPSRIVENALWKDPAIRDAAAILGVDPTAARNG